MRVSKGGCDVFVHHLETVDGLTSNCSESHLLVFFFSTSTIFNLFTSSIMSNFGSKDNDLFSFKF